MSRTISARKSQKEVLVTLRIPISLIHALDERAKTEHYKDLSELIRSIVRKRTLQYVDPYTQELKAIKDKLFSSQELQAKEKKKEKIMNDIKKLAEELHNEL
jgi:Arc/MetJ-type ribon-helix-helix transcriptional regulator